MAYVCHTCKELTDEEWETSEARRQMKQIAKEVAAIADMEIEVEADGAYLCSSCWDKATSDDATSFRTWVAIQTLKALQAHFEEKSMALLQSLSPRAQAKVIIDMVADDPRVADEAIKEAEQEGEYPDVVSLLRMVRDTVGNE